MPNTLLDAVSPLLGRAGGPIKEPAVKPAANAIKDPSVKKPKKTRYSYSRLDSYIECGYKYRLKYEEGNFIDESGIAACVGTLVHYIEESIANHIIAGERIPYEKLLDEFENIDIPEKEPEYDADGHKKKGSEGGIYGLRKIREMFRKEFYEINEDGTSYFIKCENYKTSGIYRLEKYMLAHPELKLVAVEKEFDAEFNGFLLHGYIDRILYDTSTGEYVLEDIKTKGKPFKEDRIKTPLQFVVYSIAMKKMYGLPDYPTRFNYDLPFCDLRQAAGTKGVMTRGFKKLEQTFGGITSHEFVPHPSPLCYWCEFCDNNPNRPEKGKGMCPYYSLWDPSGAHKVYETAHKWEGADQHDRIMAEYGKETGDPTASPGVAEDFNLDKPAPAAKPLNFFDF